MPITGKLPSVPGTLRADGGRISVQEQVIQQALELESQRTKIASLERDSSDLSKMLEHIHRTCADIATKVVSLQERLSDEIADLGRKMLEQRKDMQDICAIRHEHVDKQFQVLQKQDERTFGQVQQSLNQVQEMGEITKVRYIQELQRQLRVQHDVVAETCKQSFAWRKLWISALIALISAIASGYSVHSLTSKPAVVAPTK